MTTPRSISLEPVRTDGWFERLGESIGSFHTLCDILGENFFAFALITGTRVTSLMIDRFNPDQSVVEFSFGGMEGPPSDDVERLTVLEFRQRLVASLMVKEPDGPATDELGDDTEALQRHVGPRSLLLAPLYDYVLKDLVVDDAGASSVVTVRYGEEESFDIPSFRSRLQDHVQEDMDRGVERGGNTAIDLNNVDEAERAAENDDWARVSQLLGAWPIPLSIYWRTPEGQMLPDEARQRIAEGLGLLGTACSKQGDAAQGEEVLRLAVQYAQDGRAAAIIFQRLGAMFLDAERCGEAVGPLRRAKALGSPAAEVLPLLAEACLLRGRWVASLAFLLEARAADVKPALLSDLESKLDKEMGAPLTAWKKLIGAAV